MRTPTPILLLFLSLAIDVTITSAADFTRFRGADATGVAKDHPNLPDRWSKTDNVVWVADVPGQGWGSPIVVGDRVFVSSVMADEENTKPKGGLYLGQGVRDPAKGIHHWMVHCFDLKGGKELWRHEAHTGRPVVPRHPKSSYAAETPTTDGERLFVLFGDLGLYCYGLDGDLLWSKPIEPKKTNMDYGAAASPVVHDGQVFIVYDNKEDSWIASFDAVTGEQRWLTKRDETMSWATPFVCENTHRTEIVVPGQRFNRSYSLEGEELWSFDGNMSVLVIPSPFAAHGMCAGEKRPVMVWIHSGGFTQGSGHQPGYDGTQLAKRGVVAVTINYRLGALGFMTHPALSTESPHGSSGNYAILDQIAALKWVRENIENFGGDPDNVTIFGESAGGTSAYLLTATPLSKGLFHRAILQSPWLDPVIFRDLKEENENGPPAEFDGEEQARKLLGDDADADDVLVKLRAIPASDVLSKMKQRWPVATDGWVFPKAPHQIHADGDQHDIPVIVGTNRDEGTMFAPRKAFGGTLEAYKEAMVERHGENGDRVAEFYAPKSNDDLWKVAVQQITDVWFVQPARELARSIGRQNTNVWMYHFTKPVWGWMGAAHAAEIGYVFGNLEEPKPNDAALSDSFMAYWVQFAKTGNPNIDGKPAWPQYTVCEDRHLVMDKKLTVGSKLRCDACDLLDKILEARRQPFVSAQKTD